MFIKNMLDGGLSNEAVLIFLLSVTAITSVITFFVSKRNVFLTIFVLSVLTNLIVYFNSYAFFNIYNLKWMVIFALDYWPWINVALFVILVGLFVRNRMLKKK